MEETGDIAPPAGGRKIVVVDDSDDNIVLFQHLLKKIGYEDVVYFTSSAEALGACRDLGIAPDLFILDVMMPGIDGLSLAKMIKLDERMKEASIIFITARELDDTLEECFGVGGQILFLSRSR